MQVYFNAVAGRNQGAGDVQLAEDAVAEHEPRHTDRSGDLRPTKQVGDGKPPAQYASRIGAEGTDAPEFGQTAKIQPVNVDEDRVGWSGGENAAELEPLVGLEVGLREHDLFEHGGVCVQVGDDRAVSTPCDSGRRNVKFVDDEMVAVGEQRQASVEPQRVLLRAEDSVARDAEDGFSGGKLCGYTALPKTSAGQVKVGSVGFQVEGK